MVPVTAQLVERERTDLKTRAPDRQCLHPAEPDMRAPKRDSGFVKVFGCRPPRTAPQTPAAGVRKPPRDETAIWARWAGRVGPRAQLWGFERWADGAEGRATRGVS
jgi:hypothetical protein